MDDEITNNLGLSSDSPLRRAVKTGNLRKVRRLIKKYDINVPNRINWTLIHESAVSDDLFDVFQYLISAGAKIHFKSDRGASPLYVACRYGSLRIAKALVAAGCDVNEKCGFDHEFSINIPKNFTPLHVACIGNHAHMVAFLLENGADVNAKDTEERTPAFYALKEKNEDTLRLLIDAGADLFTKDINGGNVLHHACRAHFSPNTFRLLESYGLSFINDQTESGRTALMEASELGHCLLAERLIRLGADVTLVDNVGLLALHQAARSGYEIFKLLLQHTPVDTIEKYCTLESGREAWRSLPCCIIKSQSFESLQLLYSSGLSEAVLSCPTETPQLYLTPVASLMATVRERLDEDLMMDFLKLLLSHRFVVDPPYEVVREIPPESGKKVWIMALESLMCRHHFCFDHWNYDCNCNVYLSEILRHSVSHDKMIPYGRSRQLNFFSDCARYGFVKALQLLKYAEYVEPDDVLEQFLKRLLSYAIYTRFAGNEELIIEMLLQNCATNFMATFLKMKTMSLKNLSYGLRPPMSTNNWRKYQTFLKLVKVAESNNHVARLDRICRYTIRKSIQKDAEILKISFQSVLRSIPMPHKLYRQISILE